MIISHLMQQKGSQQWLLQSNEQHSKNVANIAKRFATTFGFGQIGEILGLLHDKGKEQEAFQNHIKSSSGYDKSVKDERVQHAYVGALLCKKLFPQLCDIMGPEIYGHHSGLHDYNDYEDIFSKEIPSDVDTSPIDIHLEMPQGMKKLKELSDCNHLVRVLFSCLVDADYLDTEAFMNEHNSSQRGKADKLEVLKPMLDRYLAELKKNAIETPVNKIRNQVQHRCFETSSWDTGFYSLTVPTGGGKTLSSLVWAINHAINHNKERIIIAIPYTSIITQTAAILRTIFGDKNVLEHHSNVDFDNVKDNELSEQLRLATENWDYPIVVTTNVQLFESMFSNRPKACRKLHNIVNSVLILDEVQSLPLEFLQPIIDGLKSYNRLFSTTVLFTTASLPALKDDLIVNKFKFRGIDNLTEIIPHDYELHKKLRRVELHFDNNKSTHEEIAHRLEQEKRVLCIVNTRKHAQAIYEKLTHDEMTFHLSRMMCSAHIKKTIDDIKQALKNLENEKIIVVATQLIEAGVDIDFPVVYRQDAGLDSILQAAGRCNREGKLDIGHTHVFSLGPNLPGFISNASNALKNMVDVKDWFAPETMTYYFYQLFSRTPSFDKNEIGKNYLNDPSCICFQQAAKAFKLIDDHGINIIVNYGNSSRFVNEFIANGISYHIMKKLGQYTVSVHEKDFNALKQAGFITEIAEGIYYLPDAKQYDEKIGLALNNHWLDELLIK